MKASILLVSHVGGPQLREALDSLASCSDRNDVEIVVVDNGSMDDLGDQVARWLSAARVVRSDLNLGFAGGVALGAEAAEGEVLVLLNDDAAAAEGFLEAHLECLDKHPDAAVSAGRLVTWDGARHDFLRGDMTFDLHAFQVGQGWPIGEIEPPPEGEPLPFACGGNMAIRRSDWRATGGFDRELFAYFEDVDLGWRLWASGRSVVAAPNAVARHRGSATSVRLGDFRRGVLFERNALRIFFGCADDELRGAFGPVVLATFLHRLVSFAGDSPELAAHVMDPFGPNPGPPSRAGRWWRRLDQRGVLGTLRHAIGRAIMGPDAGAPVLGDGLLLMQLRAAQGFFAGFGTTERRRRRLAEARVVPDREIVARFPRLVVPTYLGDAEWFASDEFRGLLPEGWPIRFQRLDEVVHPDLLK